MEQRTRLRRRNDQSALRTNTSELEHLYRVAPVGLCLTDLEHRYVRINQKLADINGKSVADHLGRTVQEVIPNIAPQIKSMFQRVIDSGEPILDHEVRGSTVAEPNGVRIFLGDHYPLRSKNGQVRYVSTIVRDITERKKAEEALVKAHDELESRITERTSQLTELIAKLRIEISNRTEAERKAQDSESRLRVLLESTNAVPWEANGETWQFTYVGPQAIKLLGYPPEQWYEKDFWVTHIHPEDRSRSIEYCLSASKQYTDYEFEYRMIASDGKIVWIEDIVNVVRVNGDPKLLRGFMIDISERKQRAHELKKSFEEIRNLKEQLEQETVYLRKEMHETTGFEEIIGESEPIKKVLSSILNVAGLDTTVLLTGETGTGKELAARAIHRMSNRRGRLMIKVNCSSIPEALVEAELFGREKGAYTGALTKQVGRFEIADGSTIFLDEIGDLSIELQAKLLQVLQDGKFERLGSPKTIKVDVRVIAATNANLQKALREGRFREDLYYRLNVFPIQIPPLRERQTDIPLLVWRFIKEFSGKMGKRIESISQKSMNEMVRYPWPGNIREMRNVIENAMIISSGKALEIRLPSIENVTPNPIPTPNPQSLSELEGQHIRSVLQRTHWRVSGNKGAARILGLKESTLRARMQRLGIARTH